MALTENGSTGMYMPVAPAYAGGGFGNGFGGDGWWILLLLLAFGGGWGMGGFGGYGGAMMGMDYGLYPWLNNSQHISDGFRDQQLQTSIGTLQNSVTSGFGDVQLGIAGVNQNICQTGNGITAAINASTMADMNRSFALQSQLAQCCCDNKAATADLKYTVATENCADRTAAYQNTRDIIDAIHGGNQAIIDKLCQLELDGVKNQLAAAQRDNATLQNQVILATERADRTAQTGTIIDGIYNRLATCPVDTTPVYGRQAIFQCPVNVNGNTGCGCGGGFVG